MINIKTEPDNPEKIKKTMEKVDQEAAEKEKTIPEDERPEVAESLKKSGFYTEWAADKALDEFNRLRPYILEEIEERGIEKGADLFDKVGDATVLADIITAAQKRADRHNPHRTRRKVKSNDVITKSEKTLPIITVPQYQNSVSFYEGKNSQAYLQLLKDMEGLKFENGRLSFSGIESLHIGAKLEDLRTKEGIEKINLPTLQAFYGITYNRFKATGKTESTISIHISVLGELFGPSSHPNRQQIDDILNKVRSFHNILGVVYDGSTYPSYYQVLNFESYNDKTRVVTFSAPYMNFIINRLSEYSQTPKEVQVAANKKKLLPPPTHSNLIDISIAKERNKIAVINVEIIVALIEQAGNNTGRIKATTIIDRNPQFKQRLDHTRNKSAELKRIFSKTWDLLRNKTTLLKNYKNIELPDPKNPADIPNMSTLDEMVFSFPHEGKIKNG